jgi:transcriptional regulator with XRE-family HTH domain
VISGLRGLAMPAYEELILSLAKRVQVLRKNLQLTQAALANRAGVTVETVARLERVVRGRVSANSNPSLETLSRLAIALEVELHDLLSPRPVTQRKSDQLSQLLENASPVFTQRLLRIAEALFREEQEENRHSGVYAVARRRPTGSESR